MPSPFPTPRYQEKVKKVEKRRENGKKPTKGEINQENSKKKSNRKRKQGNGREKGKKIAENRENTKNFCKICAIYIDIFPKNLSAINLKILFKSIQKSQEKR